MTKFDEALQAVQTYDSFIFSSFGRPFDADKADTLAAVAAFLLDEATRDPRENKVTHAHARVLRDQFRAICA